MLHFLREYTVERFSKAKGETIILLKENRRYTSLSYNCVSGNPNINQYSACFHRPWLTN